MAVTEIAIPHIDSNIQRSEDPKVQRLLETYLPNPKGAPFRVEVTQFREVPGFGYLTLSKGPVGSNEVPYTQVFSAHVQFDTTQAKLAINGLDRTYPTVDAWYMPPSPDRDDLTYLSQYRQDEIDGVPVMTATRTQVVERYKVPVPQRWGKPSKTTKTSHLQPDQIRELGLPEVGYPDRIDLQATFGHILWAATQPDGAQILDQDGFLIPAAPYVG